MSAKPQASPRTLAEINKQIIEIKKKIQLSEGQRKAAFEEYETERKLNADQILKLKKEIKELTVSVQKNKDESAVHRVRNVRLETIVGPLTNKTTEQVKHALDLQIIDTTKHLDLIRHRVKQRQNYLATLAQEYQTLLAQKPKQDVKKLANPFKKPPKKCKAKSEEHKTKAVESEIASPHKKKCYALQNNIHRVEVQWREAEHVRNSYRAIRGTLLQDRGLFESSLKQLEEKKESQQKDIQELQRMNAEAASTRSHARSALDREERSSLLSSRVRERQAAEQESLVAARRQDLERLERRIFQSGKTGGGVPGSTGSPGSGIEPESGTGVSNGVGEESPGEGTGTERGSEIGAVDVGKMIRDAFEKLKDATGATSSDDVLSRFQAQKDTRGRLDYLKKTTEAEKRQLEQKQDALHTELERYRYAQERDREKFSDDILNLKKGIDEQIERQIQLTEKTEEKETLLEAICKTLHNLYLALKEIGVKPSKDVTSNPEHGQILVDALYTELEDVVRRSEVVVVEENENKEATEEEPVSEEEIMPSSYNALLRRTPQPVQGHPVHMSAPVASGPEDEEEVPSRGFLKRQAQLVVDAKSRRKALRIPMNRK